MQQFVTGVFYPWEGKERWLWNCPLQLSKKAFSDLGYNMPWIGAGVLLHFGELNVWAQDEVSRARLRLCKMMLMIKSIYAPPFFPKEHKGYAGLEGQIVWPIRRQLPVFLLSEKPLWGCLISHFPWGAIRQKHVRNPRVPVCFPPRSQEQLQRERVSPPSPRASSAIFKAVAWQC